MMMKSEDLTFLFTRLQTELDQAGIGTTTSLHDQNVITESDLLCYFTNAENLRSALRIGGLTYEHAFLRKTVSWSEPILHALLAEYRSAEISNPVHLFERLTTFLPDLDGAYRHVVSIAELEADRNLLSSLAFARSCLRDSADIIESSLQPFLRLRREIRAISEGSDAQLSDTKIPALGQVLRDIICLNLDLYKPPPLNISLSEIRNIAYHGKFRIEGNAILCSYGQHRQRKEVRCEMNELLHMARNVNDIYYIHKTAFEFYCIDNIHSIVTVQQRSGQKKAAVSDLTKVAVLAYGIVAAGFRILNASRQEYRWTFSLVDRHRRSSDKAKNDFQKSVVPYLIYAPICHFTLLVRNESQNYRLSFDARLVGPGYDQD